MYSLAAQDTEFINEYLEESLANKTIKQLTNLKQKGYSLETKEETNRGIQIGRSEKIIDQVLIQGLSVDRSINKPRKDYRIWEDDSDMGLVCCTPLDVTSTEHHRSHQENKRMFTGYKKAVYRILLEV
jgi:hypothetical protein